MLARPPEARARPARSKLPEFAYLRKNVDWFKGREAQKLISLNLEDRQQAEGRDDAFRKEIKAERDRLAKADYPYKEFRLGPPPPPKIAAQGAKEAPKDAARQEGTRTTTMPMWPTSRTTPTPTPTGRWTSPSARPSGSSTTPSSSAAQPRLLGEQPRPADGVAKG